MYRLDDYLKRKHRKIQQNVKKNMENDFGNESFFSFRSLTEIPLQKVPSVG